LFSKKYFCLLFFFEKKTFFLDSILFCFGSFLILCRKRRSAAIFFSIFVKSNRTRLFFEKPVSLSFLRNRSRQSCYVNSFFRSIKKKLKVVIFTDAEAAQKSTIFFNFFNFFNFFQLFSTFFNFFQLFKTYFNFFQLFSTVFNF
jgi:hypothetical protein